MDLRLYFVPTNALLKRLIMIKFILNDIDIEMFIKSIWMILSPQMKYVYIIQMMRVGCGIED